MRLLFIFSLCFALVSQIASAAILGIDFGQGYTKSSLVAPGTPFELVLTSDSKRKDLSALTFKRIPSEKDEIERVYGNSASGLFGRFPSESPFYIKELLGVDADSTHVKSYLEKFPSVSLVESKNNRSTSSFQLHTADDKDLTFTIEELVAMSFSEIRARASKMLIPGSGYLRDVSITVPPWYTIPQRRAIEDAAEIAGLNLISLVNDGVAVAVNLVSNTKNIDSEQIHIIFDIGAGSATATMVKITPGDSSVVVDVLGMGYDDSLGGHLLTHRLREILVDKFIEQNPKLNKGAILADQRAFNRLWQEAEKVKSVLSANTETISSLESLYNDISVKTKITRAEFEESVKDLFPRVKAPINQLFSSLPVSDNLSMSNVSSIILTGGSTRTPFVQQIIQELIADVDSVSIAKNVNADEAAVLGATLRGVGISGKFKSKNISVIDRSLWDYEFKGPDGVQKLLFPKGTPLDSTVVAVIDDVHDFSMSLFENGSEFLQYSATNVKSTVDKMKCVDQPIIEAEFHLSHSRIVQLSSLTVKCVAESLKPVTVSSSTSSSSDSGENDATATTSTSTNAQPSVTYVTTQTPLSRTLRAKSSYKNIKPIGNLSKQQAIGRLLAWDRQDAERLVKEEARNELEAYIYAVREKFSDLEDEVVYTKISQLSEWLDFEGQTASLTELSSKLSELQAFETELLKGQQNLEPEKSSSESSVSTSVMQTTETATVPRTSAELNLDNALEQLQKVLGNTEETDRVLQELQQQVGDRAESLDRLQKLREEIEKAAKAADRADRTIVHEDL